MRVLKTLMGAVVAVVAAATAVADVDPDFSYEIPAYIKSISNAQGLTQYLNSKSSIERITACIRLGEIGGDDAIDLLVDAFEKEPHGSAAEAVKFQALTSIGKIGGARAEALLKQIARDYSKNVSDSTQVFGFEDSLAALSGALEGLYFIGSSSAEAFIDSIFNNGTYYWFVRYLAYINILRYDLRKGDYATASDTADFLLDILTQAGGKTAMYDSSGNFNVNFILSGGSGYLLFEYRATALTYLSDYILHLDAHDPMLPLLKKMETDMMSNPPSDLE